MGGFTLTKKQKFLAGVVCSLIVLEVASLVSSLMGPWRTYQVEVELMGSFIDPFGFAVLNAMFVLIALANVLVLLKFLLPNWKPHRQWLGWLLSAIIVFRVLNLI